MKKLLSLLMAITMLVTSLLVLPSSAQAASYEDAAVTANISSIKKYIKKNGFLNGNGNYTIQYNQSDEEVDYYFLIYVDSKSDSLIFQTNIYDNETDDIMGGIKFNASTKLNEPKYVETYFWVLSDDDSDLGGHTYIDRNFNHNTDYASFYIDYNDCGVADSNAIDLFDAVLYSGFYGWNEMLGYYMDLNMSAVGFKKYCTSHKYKTITAKKATTSSDGRRSNCCSVCGKVKSTTAIPKISTVKLSSKSYTYDGKVKKPTVTVKDSKGNKLDSSSYTVKYSGDTKNVGKYNVKITFKGKYSGTTTLEYTIKPKGTTISSVSASSKAFTVKWKKQATQTSGYQIQYSTSSSFSNPTTITVSKNSTTSKKITKLKGKKKYYVRVRTYKTVSGKKCYSSWSASKSLTTKK